MIFIHFIFIQSEIRFSPYYFYHENLTTGGGFIMPESAFSSSLSWVKVRPWAGCFSSKIYFSSASDHWKTKYAYLNSCQISRDLLERKIENKITKLLDQIWANWIENIYWLPLRKIRQNPNFLFVFHHWISWDFHQKQIHFQCNSEELLRHCPWKDRWFYLGNKQNGSM